MSEGGEEHPGLGKVGPSPGGRAVVLVLEDDARCLSSLVRSYRFAGLAPRPARSVRDGLAIAESENLDGMSVDLEMDGDKTAGFRFLELARRNHPLVPTVIVSGHFTRALYRRACDLGADYLMKPARQDLVNRWVKRIVLHREVSEGFRKRVDALADAADLTDCERRVLPLLVLGWRRAQIAKILGISEETVKSQIASARKKCGAELLHLAERVRTAQLDVYGVFRSSTLAERVPRDLRAKLIHSRRTERRERERRAARPR